MAAILTLTSLFTNFNFFKLVIKCFEFIEAYNIADFAIPVVLILTGLLIDLSLTRRKEKREAEIQEQRLRVLKATMRTVQHIVNNDLNNLQLFRLEAEDQLSTESLMLLDEVLQDTSTKLRALGDLETTPEKPTPIGICIDFESLPACNVIPLAA